MGSLLVVVVVVVVEVVVVAASAMTKAVAASHCVPQCGFLQSLRPLSLALVAASSGLVSKQRIQTASPSPDCASLLPTERRT
jgi:hypothetical protein